MSDEVKLKINVPMFEVGELEMFDNHIHDIVEEYSKMLFKEKDQILTQRIIMKQEEEIERLKIIEEKYKDSQLYIHDFKDEIERLNNIINEIEKHLEEELNRLADGCSHTYKDSLDKTRLVNEDIFNEVLEIKNKLQELKGDGSNEKDTNE